MSGAGFDAHLLLSAEVRALLVQRGLTLRVELVRANGNPADAGAREELTRALEGVETRMEHVRQLATLGEMCAGVLHEARNLLTGVVGLSLVRSNDESHVELLRNEAARCNKLLTTFLSSSSRAPTYPVRVEPGELLDGIVTLLGYEARSKRCRLVTKVDPEIPVLRSYAHELKQVLLNLTLNAIQASPEGGRITLSAVSDGDEVSFTVADEGPGVPEHMLSTIFEPFVTSKPPSEGTGLGLSTSRRLVAEIQGRLTVTNPSSGGALFTLTVAREAEPPESLPPGVIEP